VDAKRRYWFPEIGYNYRMTNIQAAIGLAQLEKIDWHMKRREEVVNFYKENLSDFEGYIELPVQKEWAKHAFWMFTILLSDSLTISRDEFMQLLLERGIETRPVFYPMHVMPLYKDDRLRLDVAEDVAKRGVSLPTHALLKAEDIVYIAAQIKNICLSHTK